MRRLLACLLLVLPALAIAQEMRLPPETARIGNMAARFAPFEVRVDLSALPENERRALASLVKAGATVVDTRDARQFASGHLPGTLNIPLSASFVTWAGWLLPYTEDLYFIVDDLDDDSLIAMVRQLALIGLDRVAGVFHRRAVERADGATLGRVAQMTPEELSRQLQAKSVSLVDVRSASEYKQAHLSGAVHIPLGYLADRVAELPTDRPIVVQCQSGARSSIAASLLERLGRREVINLTGGLVAWQAAGLPVVSG